MCQYHTQAQHTYTYTRVGNRCSRTPRMFAYKKKNRSRIVVSCFHPQRTRRICGQVQWYANVAPQITFKPITTYIHHLNTYRAYGLNYPKTQFDARLIQV